MNFKRLRWAVALPEHATAAVVKVCGCRPHDGGAAHTGAGVREPPMEETAMGERMMVPRS
jgi:hypothetical protein